MRQVSVESFVTSSALWRVVWATANLIDLRYSKISSIGILKLFPHRTRLKQRSLGAAGICQLCSRRNFTWPSIPKPPNRSALSCRPDYSASLTRSSSSKASSNCPGVRFWPLVDIRNAQSMSLLGIKRTCLFALHMSANDPKRTSGRP
jgi:hypothetical protein